MIIEFTYVLARDLNGKELISAPVEFKDWKEVFSTVGRKTFLVGAHEKSLELEKRPVVMKGLRRRHDLEV